MKSLYIENYKNLKELSLKLLAPVNLIVGRNNVGKSTLLEAISIYISNGSDEWLKTVLDIRGEMVNVDFTKVKLMPIKYCWSIIVLYLAVIKKISITLLLF